jgi:hypothetical protein
MSPNVTDSPEGRMDVHDNACLRPRGREAMVGAVVDCGLTNAEAARRFNTTAKTVAKWSAGSARKASRACATDPPDSISCRAKHRSQQAMPLKSCAGSATPRLPSPNGSRPPVRMGLRHSLQHTRPTPPRAAALAAPL